MLGIEGKLRVGQRTLAQPHIWIFAVKDQVYAIILKALRDGLGQLSADSVPIGDQAESMMTRLETRQG